MSTELRRAAERGRTRTDWLDCRHSLSFGSFYDPDDLAFGLLLAHNEDVIAPGGGYPTHAHRDTEILTWVLSGSLAHVDSLGNDEVIGPGVVQWLSAGSGVRHSELNAGDSPLQLVQLWVRPDVAEAPPAYRRWAVADRLERPELVVLASGRDEHHGMTPIVLRQRGAALSVARLPAGSGVRLPKAPFVHAFLAYGSAVFESPDRTELVAGDALRLTGGSTGRIRAIEDSELLVLEMHPEPHVAP